MDWIRPHDRFVVILPVLFLFLAIERPSNAAVIEFGWSGTVTTVAPAFAAALPSGSNITNGASAFARFSFETTTPDQDPATTTGVYGGALGSFTILIDSFAFTQRVEGPINTIIVFRDPLFGFYESTASVDPSSPIPGYSSLKGDVLFIPVTPSQIASDSLILTIPDPSQWSTASAAVLDPTGNVLLDVRLNAICTGPCQPTWPPPRVPSAARPGWAGLLIILLVLVSCGASLRLARSA